MLRRLAAPLLALTLGCVLPTAPALAQQDDAAEPTSQSSLARAWVLADADTGAVLAALNHHEPLFVASLVKVMTAFVTLEQLQIENEIEVSELAAAQPAMRIGMETGQRWKLENALHALLMVSANDAAYAMAEAASGSIEEFARAMQRTADRLGMQDSTWLDPAGFDGNEGFGGGSKASAYDLAIAARNALEVPEIAAIVRKQVYEFHGGDGKDHELRNHNKMLQTFPDATGMKTGYTRAAGHSLIATAQRNGRHLIAVVIGAGDHYDAAAALLNQGFNTPRDGKGTGEVLPATSFSRAQPPPEPEIAEVGSEAPARGGLWSTVRRLLVLLFIAFLGAFFARREQIKRRKRRRRAMRRAYLDAKRRGMIDVIDAERAFGPNRPSGHVQVIPPHHTPADDTWPPREWSHDDEPAPTPSSR